MFDGLYFSQREDADLRSGVPDAPGCGNAVVLAGVHAWGCSELEREVPRPMMPIAGRPLISHSLTWLRDGGVRRVGICANSDTPVLRRWLRSGDALRLDVDYYEDVMPRGPAGCVRDAMADSAGDPFLVIDGTIVPRLNLADLVSFHIRCDAALTVVSEPSGKMGKGSERLAPVGIYVCSRRILEHIPTTGYQDIKESLIPKLYAAGDRVVTCVVEAGLTPRVSTLASYLAVSKWELSRLVSRETCPPDYQSRERAWIHRSAVVAESARIVGPVLVEADSRVAEGAIVVGPTTIGRGSRVGPGAVVCRSILWSGCVVEADSRLDHCVLANEAAVPAHWAARNRVCLGPSRGWGGASQLRTGWSRGLSPADEKVQSADEACDKRLAQAVSVPKDRLVGMPSSTTGRHRSGPSRQIPPVRVHSHGR